MTLVLALWGTTATAQVRLGVKGGYNYTNWKFGKLDLKGDGKNGFFVGPTLKINLPAIVPAVGFGLNVSGLYDQRKVKVGEADPVEIKTKMVAVPVNLQLDFLARTLRLCRTGVRLQPRQRPAYPRRRPHLEVQGLGVQHQCRCGNSPAELPATLGQLQHGVWGYGRGDHEGRCRRREIVQDKG